MKLQTFHTFERRKFPGLPSPREGARQFRPLAPPAVPAGLQLLAQRGAALRQQHLRDPILQVLNIPKYVQS